MTIAAQHFQTRTILVGFRAVPLVTDRHSFYSRVRIKASPDNTVPVFIGPAPAVTTFGELVGWPLAPGEFLDLEIESPILWAIANDLNQELNWVGL